jgi:glycosyltransferase involved in cell wall biosynthesis
MKADRMRVAFNATSLLSPLTGIGQYSRQLAAGLTNHPNAAPEFFYGAIWSKEVRGTPHATVASALPWLRSHVPGSYALRRMVQNFRFSSHAKATKFDLYHEPNFLPLPFDGPTIVTVHDLSWIRYPLAHPAERVKAMDKYFEQGLRRVSLVLTDSEFVKQELIEVFGIRPERIKPVALGVESMFHPQLKHETALVLGRHNLHHGEYILAVGTLEPRKNLQVALGAFMQLPPVMRQRFPLVLVGMRGWHTTELEQQLAPLVRTGEIRQLGYLPREDLATLTAGSTCLIYPSLYEGFGLPPLEAMASGVPVIASNVSSIPEVVGDGGVLIDPQDVDGFARAIEMVTSAPDVREAFASKALLRSRLFSWEKCVEETVSAYREVLSKS